MKLSRYVKVYPYEAKPGYLLLYSTTRSSKVLLKEKTFNSIINGTLSPKNEAALLKLGMITPDPENEKKEASGFIDSINAISSTLNITVIVNLDCNFNCVYCYEGSLKGKFYMTAETAGLLTDFIKDKFTPGIKTINIDFYGGEPLLSAELIKSISAEMRSFADGRGVKYTFTLVTNGSLFTRRIAEDLSALGLKGIKTTLDGPPETHNISRPFKSGTGSFDTIIRNIKETCDIVKIGIGGNYDSGNYKNYPLLFEHLEKEGLTPDRVYQVRFEPVMKNSGDVGHPFDLADGCMSVNDPWVIESYPLLREEVLKRGYYIPKVSPTPCQVDLNNAYVVNYDGVIYKCTSFIGRKAFEIGTVRDGVTDYSRSHNLGIWKNNECEECEYLPLCFGGCRYSVYVRDGNIDNVDCKKPHYDAVLETLIKQDVRYSLS